MYRHFNFIYIITSGGFLGLATYLSQFYITQFHMTKLHAAISSRFIVYAVIAIIALIMMRVASRSWTRIWAGRVLASSPAEPASIYDDPVGEAA